MDNKDIYQLFINFNVPGVRKEVARLAQGVNTGDAGVMGELLQAAYDPSAGQQALQAGEAVQKPCLAFDHQALVSAIGTSVGSAMSTSMIPLTDAIKDSSVVIKDNFEAVGQILDTVVTLIVDNKAEADAKMAENKAAADAKMAENKADADAKMAENKADADAKMAENKADADAKMARNKAETDAKMAEIVSALTRVGTDSATGCVPNLPKRTNQRYTAESKKITLQWLVKHISNPYPDRDEMECLQNKTGVDTIKRMTSLVTQIRTKEMVKDKNGKWCKRVMPKHASVLGNTRWTQKSISDCM
jgi:hypothetical protein